MNKIVVLTPVKNEEWILRRFLDVTSEFADYIIILDQGSTDNSLSICKQYNKVILLDNYNARYDESYRQIRLINEARKISSEQKILFALDADEILAANALATKGWETMLNASPGTVLFFEKPDLYINTSHCIRFDNLWPIGFVDDGSEHKPRKVHSIRIPIPDHAKYLYLNDVKILHYAMSRLEAQASKMRMYSVIENVY